MKENELEKHISWFKQERPIFEAFSNKLYELLYDLLDSEKIEYHSVDTRVKSYESFEKKITNGVVNNPKKMQDLVGVRIVGYTYSDVDKIKELIEKNFEVDPKKITDKSEYLGIDRVGYRAQHIVATLTENRCELAEFKKYKDMQFEIQIPTILQHAWAEIQHDKNYKFSGKLPSEIQRQVNLLAGTLEIVDNEFERISKSVQDYSDRVSSKTKSGELDIEINTISLRRYLFDKFGDNENIIPTLGSGENNTRAIEELNRMDINTLSEFEKIIPKDLHKIYKKTGAKTTFNGLIRQILMIHDIKKYFKKAWQGNWNYIDKNFGEILDVYSVDRKSVEEHLVWEQY